MYFLVGVRRGKMEVARFEMGVSNGLRRMRRGCAER